MDYMVLGAGGDLCLPGAVEYQHLHADVRESNQVSDGRLQTAKDIGIEIATEDGSDEPDLTTRRRIIDFCPAVVTINFAMCDLTWENGPIRQILGSHTWQMPPPPPADEPEWMRMSTLVGAPAGAGVIRDNRAWHGATPNLSREIRSLPNVEYGAPWLGPKHTKTMPHPHLGDANAARQAPVPAHQGGTRRLAAGCRRHAPLGRRAARGGETDGRQR